MASAFGKNLERLVRTRHLSGRQMAKIAGVPTKTAQEWVGANARIPRDPEVIRRLAEHFGVSVHFLLFGEEDPLGVVGQILDKTEIHTGLYEITIRRVTQKI